MKQLPEVRRDATPKFALDETYRPPSSGSYVIFAMTGAWGVGEDVFRLFELLNSMNVNTIVVINGALNEEDLTRLKSCVHRILMRGNLGRDFGAFRAATLQLYRENVPCKRVAYLNDSIYYINRKSLTSFLGAMFDCDPHYDVVSATENQEFSHHFGSFAISMSDKVFFDEKIKKFWRSYRPYNLRVHAIHAGERELSLIIKSRHFKVNVLYCLAALTDRLVRRPFKELVSDSVALLPSNANPEKKRILDELNTSIFSVLKLLSNMIERDESIIPLGTDMPQYFSPRDRADSFRRSLEKEAMDLLQTVEGMTKQHLIDRIINYFGSYGQIHLAWGFFNKYMDMPIVKKDLFYRAVFLENELSAIFENMDESEREYMRRMQIGRGRCAMQTNLDERLKRYLKLV